MRIAVLALPLPVAAMAVKVQVCDRPLSLTPSHPHPSAPTRLTHTSHLTQVDLLGKTNLCAHDIYRSTCIMFMYIGRGSREWTSEGVVQGQ